MRREVKQSKGSEEKEKSQVLKREVKWRRELRKKAKWRRYLIREERSEVKKREKQDKLIINELD